MKTTSRWRSTVTHLQIEYQRRPLFHRVAWLSRRSLGQYRHGFKTANRSKPADARGASIVMEDGVKSQVQPYGMANGTVISVEHLFQNTPARLAFQRRPETETARIVDVVVDHALAHPGCSFHLKTERRSLLNVPATESMLDRLYDIMGAQATELVELQLPPDDEQAPGEERWSGWISTPDITRGKGDDIHVLINQRPVAAGPFLQAIRRGYKPVLCTEGIRWRWSISNAPKRVDVNVHPTNAEVRLRHSWRVLERLERAIAHTLEAVPTEPDATGGIPASKDFPADRTLSQLKLTSSTWMNDNPQPSLATAAAWPPTKHPQNLSSIPPRLGGCCGETVESGRPRGRRAPTT